jgi:hypothetical protein
MSFSLMLMLLTSMMFFTPGPAPQNSQPAHGSATTAEVSRVLRSSCSYCCPCPIPWKDWGK